MQLVRTLIIENNGKYEHFGYYEGIIDVIELHAVTQPDVCIEGCKSLIEGVSKSILKSLDATFNQEEVDGQNFQQLFKRALQKLAEHKDEIEIDFIHRAVSLIQILGEIRNKRGDISHGKLAPKELFSYAQFSKLVMQMTEGIVFYVLEQFFSIDLAYKEETKYEANATFNLWLDESNPIENLSYSKALFDQDNVAYFEQLLEYQTEQEEETAILEVEEIE